MSLSSMEILWI